MRRLFKVCMEGSSRKLRAGLVVLVVASLPGACEANGGYVVQCWPIHSPGMNEPRTLAVLPDVVEHPNV